MDVVSMRCRLIIYAVFAVLFISDLFVNSGSVRASSKSTASRVARSPIQSAPEQAAPMGPSLKHVLHKLQTENSQLTSADEAISSNEIPFSLPTAKQKIENIKESCLPKLLCEMASKPQYMLVEKEKELMNMIKSTSMSLASYRVPKYWHFATHMGELLRHSFDGLSGPMGCANLWPKCPITSKKLRWISNAMEL